jgi:hypothetical protein
VVRRRELTYKEKKFNRHGRRGLIDHFTPKYDTDKIRMWALTEQNYKMSTIEAKALAQKLREKTFEEKREFIESMVDAIIHYTKMFDFQNIEAFAMWVYVMKEVSVGVKEGDPELPVEEFDRRMEKAMREAYELYEEDPNKFLDILKIFR